MGIFGNLFKKNTPKFSKEEIEAFNEQYQQLKDLAPLFNRCEYCSPKQAYQLYDTVLPIMDQFLEIANNINQELALNTFRTEAKEAPDQKNAVIPYHSVFRSCAFGHEDDWQRVVKDCEKLRYQFINYHDKIEQFNKRYADVPQCNIELSDINLKRNKMITIPEIKYTAVGKSFNKDKLLKFIVVDTETTGLKASSERIIQLSAVKYVEWQPVEVWNSYINPKRSIPEEASAINGITDDMVADKPTIKEVAESFIQFVGDWDIVGYNLPFDFKFLFAEGIDLTEKKRKYYDVYSLAKKVYKKELDSFTLENVASYNRIYYDAHDSLNDCYATAEVFENVINDITSDY